MKLTTFLMITAILQVCASALAQKITLLERDAPLILVFNQISTQTGYDFAFTSTTLRDARSVSIDVKNADLDDVLKQIFNGQPFEYTIAEKSVIISRKEASLFEGIKDKTAKLLALPQDISGRVIDSIGQPLIGASVSLRSTKYNILTDNKGNFTFPSVPEGKYTLVITYIGYARLEKTIQTEGKALNLSLVLHPSVSALDQVQVIGYGVESKRFSVGSYSTITAEDIARQPVTNVLLALQGQAPGLAINATSGVPGSSVLVQVRGQNTLNPSAAASSFKPYDQPLFIVDGVPFQQGNKNNANTNQLSNLATASSFSGGISQADWV